MTITTAPDQTIDRLLRPPTGGVPMRLGVDPLPPPLRDGALGVLDITEWFGDTSGGIRTYLLQKARHVAARPWLRQTLVVPGARDAITDDAGVRLYRVQGPPIPGQKPYRFMLATRSVARIVRHERPDLVEIGSPLIVPWIARHATRDLDLPLVCFHHTNLPRVLAPFADGSSLPRRLLHRASWRYMRRLDRLFPLTIVASRFAAADLAREGITRIAHVPLGVDLERFHPRRRASSSETRRRFGLPDGPLAMYVGRFAREKALPVVLEAWGDVERRTGARLALVGDGPMRSALCAHPYASRVTFVPFAHDRDTVADLLAAADVYVAPGPIETFGLAAVEAMASGTPVLSCDQGAVAEHVVAADGGRTYRTGFAASCAEEAIALLRSDLARLGARGRDHAEREHGWDTVFDRLFAVYRDVLGR
jgi:alpha-1,6-mannosyltransferase